MNKCSVEDTHTSYRPWHAGTATLAPRKPPHFFAAPHALEAASSLERNGQLGLPTLVVIVSPSFLRPHHLYNHLRNALTTQRLAALELLALDRRQQVEDGSKHEQHSRRNQSRSTNRQA